MIIYINDYNDTSVTDNAIFVVTKCPERPPVTRESIETNQFSWDQLHLFYFRHNKRDFIWVLENGYDEFVSEGFRYYVIKVSNGD